MFGMYRFEVFGGSVQIGGVRIQDLRYVLARGFEDSQAVLGFWFWVVSTPCRGEHPRLQASKSSGFFKDQHYPCGVQDSTSYI